MTMKYHRFLLAAALALPVTAAEAQTTSVHLQAKQIIQSFLNGNMTRNTPANLAPEGMNPSTTKPCQTTTYTYTGTDWKQQATTKTEYDSKGHVTATEIRGDDSNTRTEYTYDGTLDGFVTKTVSYSWDEASASWTSPVTTSSIELTKDGKGRVVKETVYAYDRETDTLEKESEIEFGYSLLTGRMNSISTTISSEDDNGNVTETPVKITIIKWYRYNADKLFNFSLDNLGTDMLNDTDNLIESATVSTSFQNFPIVGTLNGKYTDTSSSLTLELPFMNQTLIKMQVAVNTTDAYGSNESNISMNVMGTDILTATVKNTNNEHGDCIKTETSGSMANGGDWGVGTGLKRAPTTGLDWGNDSVFNLNLNQTLTYDYVYETLSDNLVLKKSVVTNLLDKTSQAYVPTLKTTYDEYIDYVSGITGIKDIKKEAGRSDINGVYGLNGVRMGNSTTGMKKGLYIIKENGMTRKVIK